MNDEQPVGMTIGDLVLRAFRPADRTDLVAAFTDPEIERWNPQSQAADVATWIASRNDWSAGDHASWALADDTDRLVGSVSLHHVDRHQGDAELGYWVAPWARRRGIALRAVAAATTYGFETLGLHRIYLHHAAENEASCVVATRAGFALEGTLRQSHRYGDGLRHDEHLHARLITDPAV